MCATCVLRLGAHAGVKVGGGGREVLQIEREGIKASSCPNTLKILTVVAFSILWCSALYIVSPALMAHPGSSQSFF